MNRRNIIMVGAAASVLPFPALTQSATDTPVVTLYREWSALRDLGDARRPTVLDGPADDQWLEANIFAPMDLLSKRAMELPCRVPADFAAKMLMRTCNGDLLDDWVTVPDLVAEAHRLVRSPQ